MFNTEVIDSNCTHAHNNMRYKPIGRAAQIKYIKSLLGSRYYVDDNILETRRLPTLLLRRRPYYNDTIIYFVFHVIILIVV